MTQDPVQTGKIFGDGTREYKLWPGTWFSRESLSYMYMVVIAPITTVTYRFTNN